MMQLVLVGSERLRMKHWGWRREISSDFKPGYFPKKYIILIIFFLKEYFDTVESFVSNSRHLYPSIY